MKFKKIITLIILSSLAPSPLQATSTYQESQITAIRKVYNEVNEHCTIKTSLSNEIILYNDYDANTNDYKISYHPVASNTSYEFYFENNQIRFVFSNTKVNKTNYENRYYFNNGNMIRWIDSSKTTYNQDSRTYEYIRQENEILTLVNLVKQYTTSHFPQQNQTYSDMSYIISQSFANFALRDNYGQSYQVYAYADNATIEYASMDNSTVWAGAGEGDRLITGNFKLAYWDNNTQKIVQYDATYDFSSDGFPAKLNTENYCWELVPNAYVNHTDFLRVKIPESSNWVSNYMYTIKDGKICKVLDGDSFRGDKLIQKDANTFVRTYYDWTTGEWSFAPIIYNAAEARFEA